MKKYIFSEKVGKKVTKHEIVAETLQDAQLQLASKLETELGTNIVDVGLPDYIEPVDYPADITLKTYNITYWPDPDDRDLTETLTYKALSMDSATGKFLEDFPEQAGQPRETHSPLGNYAIDRATLKNAEEPKKDNPPKETQMKKTKLMNTFKTVNEYVQQITLLLVGFIPLLLLGVVIFGDDFFLGNLVLFNIQQLLSSMAGFVGLVTLLLIVYFYTRLQQKEK